METIRQVGMMLCGCSLLSMLFSFLLPKTGLSNAVKGCAGVFFTAAMLYAILQCEWDIMPDMNDRMTVKQQQTAIAAKQKTVTLTENALSDRLVLTLRNGGLKVKKAQVELHINTDGSIEISRVVVETAAEDAMAAADIVEAEYGVRPQIILSDGDAG